ncbi:RDD family protein [Seongchinamella sediminis]|uniref:RDD family protein n=1 Tax=Seongchinamella sediminis TaxID=2283635 RepID=A0A3L7E0E7_9GAMM|nr:RDD family protein [Seongchinamella sediminis]RLQ21592.1 RDD family protein [Seongchinamella sediminis]
MENSQLKHPSLLRHLISMVYDGLLVIALVFVVNGIALALVVQLSGGEREVLNPHLGQVLIALSLVGFYSAFWLKSGQTLGMQAWRIKLVSIDGTKPRWSQALLRCAGAALSAGCLGLGYLWRLVDRNQRYWHDYLSGTELLLLPRASRGKD